MAAEDAAPELRQRLRGFQIFFIVISSVIGTGVFSRNGEALLLSGPLGLLLTVIILGIIACCVGETVSELVQVWAVPNAVYEYVAAFVDKDLALVVAILYWYAFTSAFGVQILGAANLMKYWNIPSFLPPLVIYGCTPWILLICNMLWVDVYGWTETFFGALKGVLVFGVSCVLFNIATQNTGNGEASPFSDLMKSNPILTISEGHAWIYGVPAVAYSFVGIETTVIAAFEAKTSRSMARPSQWTHWFVFVVYFLCALGLGLTVHWDDAHLNSTSVDNLVDPKSNSATIIAVYPSSPALAGFINGCLIMSTLSAANTSLYVASRTLYGLLSGLPRTNSVSRWFRRFSEVWSTTSVPAWTILITVILFYWLPWLGILNKTSVNDVLDTLSITSSVACLIVWAAFCLAFIRFERWTNKCKQGLIRLGLKRFIRRTREYKTHPERTVWALGMFFQPLIAWMGLLGCLMVFISGSATWWSTPATLKNVASAYGPHLVGFVLWVVLKCYRFIFMRETMEFWVPLEGGVNPIRLKETLEHLEHSSAYAARRGEGRFQRDDSSDGDSSREMQDAESFRERRPVVVGPE